MGEWSTSRARREPHRPGLGRATAVATALRALRSGALLRCATRRRCVGHRALPIHDHDAVVPACGDRGDLRCRRVAPDDPRPHFRGPSALPLDRLEPVRPLGQCARRQLRRRLQDALIIQAVVGALVALVLGHRGPGSFLRPSLENTAPRRWALTRTKLPGRVPVGEIHQVAGTAVEPPATSSCSTDPDSGQRGWLASLKSSTSIRGRGGTSSGRRASFAARTGP